MRINDYNVSFVSGGIFVGCTYVTDDQVKAVHEAIFNNNGRPPAAVADEVYANRMREKPKYLVPLSLEDLKRKKKAA